MYSNRLLVQFELARAYQAADQIGRAVELLEHVVAVEGESCSEDNADRLASIHELAPAYEMDG